MRSSMRVRIMLSITQAAVVPSGHDHAAIDGIDEACFAQERGDELPWKFELGISPAAAACNITGVQSTPRTQDEGREREAETRDKRQEAERATERGASKYA